MTIWHILALIYATFWYRGANKLIKERYQNAGAMKNGWFKPSVGLYREGNDAVDVGRIMKYFSIILAIVILTDILGLHSVTFHFFVAEIILYNTVIFFLYPIKSDSPDEKKKKPETADDM